MATIVGISGSLRAQSFNSALLRAAARAMPDGVTLSIESIAEIPLYNGDVEVKEGVPGAVARLKDRIAAADGLLLATPEYNNAMPGVLKNAIDWLTRPPEDAARVFTGRPIAIMGASPGQFGTTLSQNAWLPVIRTLRMRPWFEGRLMVARAASVFDAAGEIIDPKIQEQLERFVQGFADFVARGDRSIR